MRGYKNQSAFIEMIYEVEVSGIRYQSDNNITIKQYSPITIKQFNYKTNIQHHFLT